MYRYYKYYSPEGSENIMVNKINSKNKQFVRLGIFKNVKGDFEYIYPSDKNKSRYESIKKYEKR
jgi:hypothetical protein